MEGRDKRKPLSVLPAHRAKRCKNDDTRRSWANKRCTIEAVKAADSSNFEKSGTPERFMFYTKGEWHDFSQDTRATLMAAFQARHGSVEFTLRGNRYLLSFIRMLLVNLMTGFCQSIAWTDVSGRIFSPLKCIEVHGTRHRKHTNNCSLKHDSASSSIISMSALPHEDASPGLTCKQSPLDMDTSQQSSTRSTVVRPCESSASTISGHDCPDKGMTSASWDTSSTVDSPNSVSDATSSLHDDANGCARGLGGLRNFPALQDKLVTLKETEPEFDEVKTRFMAGLLRLAKDATITSISKNCHRSSSGCVRQQAFKQQEEMTKRARGDANVKYAWYGTSKEGVSSVVLHGFGQPKNPMHGAMYGAGIYLAPENYAYLSAVYSDVDENGEQHMLLCRVIMGHMEQVRRGSVQFHPSNEGFDAGVDDLHNPKQYIVWSTHMNTYILPEYIVSFKLTTRWQGTFADWRKRKVHGKSSQSQCQHAGCVEEKGDSCAESAPRCSYSPPILPRLPIEMLFFLLKSSLSAERMDALQQLYLRLKDRRLSSTDFISHVRVIAGDDLVNRCIKSMHTVLGAFVFQNLLASGRCRRTADGNKGVA